MLTSVSSSASILFFAYEDGQVQKQIYLIYHEMFHTFYIGTFVAEQKCAFRYDFQCRWDSGNWPEKGIKTIIYHQKKNRKKNTGCYYGFKKTLGMFQTPFLSSGLDIVPINLGNHCIFPLYCKSNFGARLCESKSHPQKKYQFTPKQCKCHFVNKASRKLHLKNHCTDDAEA